MKYAKRVILIFLIFLFLAGFIFNLSCGKSKTIIGTWQGQTGCGPTTIVFSKDHTARYTFMGDTGNFKWEIKGDTIITTESNRKEKIRFEMPDKNTLILYFSDGSSIILNRVGK